MFQSSGSLAWLPRYGEHVYTTCQCLNYSGVSCDMYMLSVNLALFGPAKFGSLWDGCIEAMTRNTATDMATVQKYHQHGVTEVPSLSNASCLECHD